VLRLVKRSNLNLVTIDFSINSPGVCILKDGKPYFISYLKPKTGTKKEQKLQEEMGMLDDVTLIYQEEPNIEKQELTRVLRHINIAEGLCDIIAEHTDTSQPYGFYFEGSSYGTSRFGTNSLIDLASASSILKSLMIDRFNVIAMEVYAPTTIKKHAGKGNMSKQQMWEAFLCLETLKDSQFWNFCLQFKDQKKIMKPLDDLVDAYFLLSYQRSLQS
jgi:hypothetical protein